MRKSAVHATRTYPAADGAARTAPPQFERRAEQVDRRRPPNGWESAERRNLPDRRDPPMTLGEAQAALPQAQAGCADADAASVSAEAAWTRASAEYEKAEAAWSEARARHMRARATLAKVQACLAGDKPA